uniref:Uncharacterized protein ycf23 n=1 Tax=Ophidocladus simpliciusculus TaxID=1261574 RepID=A0A1Z1MIP9_9FLOR|nr:hypothetical protein [Ophidocladus simpliciusculus]ARW65950.1 hypothetical protein [Ophidocladus simpliciusculus]
MNLFNTKLIEHFNSKQVVKVITGINSSNIFHILKLAKAAELSNATYLDVAANTKVIKILKSFSNVPICVSSINPLDLYNCVLAGADLIEIGNFDIFYKQGIYLSPSQVIDLVKEIRLLIEDVDICVTIPYYLNLFEQVKLAQNLQDLDINILQTESLAVTNKLNLPLIDNMFNSINLSSLSLLSTYIIASSVQIPVISSSKINNLSTPIAKYYGASGIGIGSALSDKDNIYDMTCYINEIHKSLVLNNNLNDFHNNVFIPNFLYYSDLMS